MKKWITSIIIFVLAMGGLFLVYTQSPSSETIEKIHSQKSKTHRHHGNGEAEQKATNESTINIKEVFESASSGQEDTKNNKEDATIGVIPKKIIIPKANVNAMVEKVGLTSSGKVGSPEAWEKTGWYKNGAKPGEKGNAIIDGHVDSYKGPAVFYYLEDLKKGDEVYIIGENGDRLTFKVVKIESYPRNNAPIQSIFSYSAARRLNLITCTGNFNEEAGTHNKRLVVYTVLVDSKSA